MFILNPFSKEWANITGAYVNVSGYYLCRRTLHAEYYAGRWREQCRGRKKFMMDFKGERRENNFSPSNIEAVPYNNSKLFRLQKSSINTVFSKK